MNQDGITVWLTGLPSSGKTTIGRELLNRFISMGLRAELLDGDVTRERLAAELGFSEEDRWRHIRRVTFVANLLARNGVIVIVSAIAPYRRMRQEARSVLGEFVEVYVNAPLAVCEARDVKGLYRRARSGELHSLTGVGAPYEPPLDPDVECATDRETPVESADKVFEFVANRLHCIAVAVNG